MGAAEGDDAGLGGGVNGGVSLPLQGRGGGDIDDPPAGSLGHHLADDQLRHKIRGLQVQFNGAVKRGHIRLQEGAFAPPSGVVDQNVHMAEGSERLGQDLFAAFRRR